jgi:hypothetical protein
MLPGPAPAGIGPTADARPTSRREGAVMTFIFAERSPATLMLDQPFAIASAQPRSTHRTSGKLTARVNSQDATSCRDHAFIGLLDAFRSHGGLLRGDELADALARKGQGDHSALARMIVAGQVVSFEWNGEYWLPAFQLQGDGLALRPEAARVVAELSGVLDGWETAGWFATRNGALQDRVPVDVIRHNPDEVVNAARLERFVARG